MSEAKQEPTGEEPAESGHAAKAGADAAEPADAGEAATSVGAAKPDRAEAEAATAEDAAGVGEPADAKGPVDASEPARAKRPADAEFPTDVEEPADAAPSAHPRAGFSEAAAHGGRALAGRRRPEPQHGPQAAARRSVGHRDNWSTPAEAGGSHPTWADRIAADPPAVIRMATLWASLATAVLSMLLLADGVALNLLIVAVPATLAALFAGQAAGRRPRPLTWVWAAGGLGLLLVPALRDAGWPSSLAVVAAFGMGSLAVHGSRTWLGVLLNPLGVIGASGSGAAWAWRGLRARAGAGRGRVGPVLRAAAVSAVLLAVFGGLFASADEAFSDLLSGLIPDASVSDGPWRVLLFALGALLALAAAHSAAAPLSWDRLTVRQGRPRGRLEWALPLVVLNILFGVFNVIQLTVLFGGYDAALRQGLTYADYARQGFWQLLFATLLTLVVIALASRWAPRDARVLVRGVLGTLCGMTLVVVASALRRLDMYVDAYGLTRLRISVMAAEIWFGVVIVLIIAAGIWGARWLPRAVVVSAAGGVLVFGLVSPDALIAERNVQRYEDTGRFDLDYASGLSADAVPAFESLPEPLLSCAVGGIVDGLGAEEKPWYATSLGEARARRIAEGVPEHPGRQACLEVAFDAPSDSGREGY